MELVTIEGLYEAFEEKLHRYAVQLGRDAHQADDLVQNTFIRAMGHLELLKLLNSYQQDAWLRQTLKRLFLDEERARRRERFLEEQLSWRTQMTVQLQSNLVWEELLDQLPDQHRELVHKRYVLGMNSTEIARELDIPAATVRSRLHLALATLRAKKSRFE